MAGTEQKTILKLVEIQIIYVIISLKISVIDHNIFLLSYIMSTMKYRFIALSDIYFGCVILL